MTDLTQTLDRLEALLERANWRTAKTRSGYDAALRDIRDELPTLIASVRALLAEREALRTSIEFCSGSCTLPPPPEKEAI